MSAWNLLAFGVGAATAAALAVVGMRRPQPDLVRLNYAGRPVPAVLGLAMVLGALLGRQVAFLGAGDAYRWRAWDVATLIAAFALLGVGLIDDRSSGGPRGIGGHLAALLSGRPTTGVLKLATGVAAGVVIATLGGDGVVRVAFGAVLIAASVGVVNALDVVPGRALKWGIVAVAAVMTPLWEGTYGLLGAATLGAALAVLPADLGERGMLGDAGSNPLGLIVGVGLYLALPTPGVVAAASVAVALQGAAETVSITRLIEATPPLAWLDRLGRR